VWTEIIGQTLTGGAAIITALGGLLLARSRQISADLAACQAEEAAHRMWRARAERHLRLLERSLWQQGLWVPDRPEELL
jgi:hypothetical protein